MTKIIQLQKVRDEREKKKFFSQLGTYFQNKEVEIQVSQIIQRIHYGLSSREFSEKEVSSLITLLSEKFTIRNAELEFLGAFTSVKRIKKTSIKKITSDNSSGFVQLFERLRTVVENGLLQHREAALLVYYAQLYYAV